jgi:hypothetical protein
VPRRADFIRLLSREDYERWEAYMRTPGVTVEQVHDWLCAECGLVDSREMPDHPRRVSRTAVGDELKKFKETDPIRGASDLADAIATVHAEHGGADHLKAIQLQLSQRLMTRLADGATEQDDQFLHDAAGTLERLSRSGRHTVKLEQELDQLKRQKAEAVRAAEAMAKSGGSVVDVVSTIKAALGITV